MYSVTCKQWASGKKNGLLEASTHNSNRKSSGEGKNTLVNQKVLKTLNCGGRRPQVTKNTTLIR